VLRLFASATAVTAGLVLFGFFSQASLFQFAGLPLLSAEPIGLAEDGARAIIESFAAVGLFGAILLLVGGLVVWTVWVRRHEVGIGKYLQMPALLGAVQLAMLLLFATTLSSLVSIAQLATPGGRDDLASSVNHVVAELRESPNWTPQREQILTEELTYCRGPMRLVPHALRWLAGDLATAPQPFLECRGPASLLGEYFRRWQDGGPAPDSISIDSREPELGVPLRATRNARERARRLYGTLFLTGAVGPVLVVLLRAWRAWQARRRPVRWHGRRSITRASLELGAAELQGRDRPFAGFYDASVAIAEPALFLLSVFVLGLLPVAHGVLGAPAIGLQQVMVRLRPQTTEGHACAGGPSPSQQAADAPTGQGASCAAGNLESLEERIVAYRQAWLEVFTTRPGESDTEAKAKAFESAVDSLVGILSDLGCPEAFRRVWLLLPQQGEIEQAPDLMSYFLDAWNRTLTHESPLRFGYLLAYPRGADSSRLYLIEPREMRVGSAIPRVVMHEVPRDCVASIEPGSDERKTYLERAVVEIRASPQPARLDAFLRYPGGEALRECLELLESRALPEQAQLHLMTVVGALARVSGSTRPELYERALRYLLTVLRTAADGSQDLDRVLEAKTAATSLSVAGGPYAATRMIAALSLGGGVLASRAPEVVTSAGFLANDLVQVLGSHPPMGDGCAVTDEGWGPDFGNRCQSPLLLGRRALEAFLATTAATPKMPSSVRAGACSGLLLTGTASSARLAFETAMDLLEHDPAASLRTGLGCLVATPNTRLPAEARGRLKGLIRGSPPSWSALDEEGRTLIRRTGLMELYEAGLWDEADLMFELTVDEPSPAIRELASMMLAFTAPRPLAARLLNCAEEATGELERRTLCLQAMLNLQQQEDGDDDRVSQRLEHLAEAGQLREEACAVLRAYATTPRDGFEASRWLKARSTVCPESNAGDGPNPEEQLRQLLQQLGASAEELEEAGGAAEDKPVG
jgi:hypothetical protein